MNELEMEGPEKEESITGEDDTVYRYVLTCL